MLSQEFDRQVERLLQKGVPALLGTEQGSFKQQLEPLREQLCSLALESGQPAERERIPFVIVLKIDWEAAGAGFLAMLEKNGKPGFSIMAAEEIGRFQPIEAVQLPEGPAYLLTSIDTGKDTLNVTPNEAYPKIAASGRSPLTIDEGIALLLHAPEMLKKNHGFSLLGSRCGDRRVSALWISAGRPKLGWCWAGNPHTWLGSASCGDRLGMSGRAEESEKKEEAWEI